MSLTDPTATITAIAAALCDTAAWLAEFTVGPGQAAAALAACYYPDAPPGSTAPFAVISTESNRTGKIVIVSTDSIGDLQELAQAISFQIMSIYRGTGTGLVIADEPSVSEVGEPSDWQAAAGTTANAIEITFRHGINL